MKILVSLGLSIFIGVSALVLLPVFVAAQEPAASAATTAKGVHANTDGGVLPLSAYFFGVAKSLPVGTKPTTVPNIKKLNSFVVNLPGVQPSHVALYWVNGLTEIWSEGQQPLKSETKTHTGGFEISSAELNTRTYGFAMLVIKDPGSQQPKFYAVHFGDK